MSRNIGEALAADLDRGFEALFEATRHRVYALALSLTRSRPEAEDVAQDAYVRAYRALGAYSAVRRRALAWRAWMAKIALNVWRNRVRRARRDDAALEEHDVVDPGESPEAAVERTESAARVRALLADLPERYRLAIVMRHAYGLPYAEAASALGIPIGTLKANVHRGAKLLRAAYERAERTR